MPWNDPLKRRTPSLYSDPRTHLRDVRPALSDRENRIVTWFMLLVLIALVFVFGFAAGTAYAAEPCVRSVELIPKAATFMQPHSRTDYTVRVRIRAHADHRLLVLSWDSDRGQAGSSWRELADCAEQPPCDGSSAPETWSFPQKGMPAARYTYVAAVFNDKGKQVGRRTTSTILVGSDGGQ